MYFITNVKYNNYMDILGKIDSLRTQRSWTFYELSVRADLPQSTLANMFARKTDPSISTLAKICNAFDISLSEFFAENENEKRNNADIKLLENFNKLNNNQKQAIINLINDLKK